MNADDIHPTFRQALGFHEGFRRLGFRSEDLYVAYQPATKIFYVQLRTQDKTFSVSVGYIEGTEEVLYEQWIAIATAAVSRALSEAAMQQCWAESLAYADPNGFIHAILQKGFTIPNAARLAERGKRHKTATSREN